MQIFCDESGGTDAVNNLFIVAAVAMSANDASRLIKSFRKATNIKGEIKGHTLSLAHRKIFFDLVVKAQVFDSVVVTSSRIDPVGGWAMGAMKETDLYGHLLMESCLGVLKADVPHLTITPDGGRYKKAECACIAEKLSSAVSTEHAGRVSVQFQNSAQFDGLQIVDVVVNTAFQALGNTLSADDASALLMPLVEAGRIELRSVELAAVRPGWLEPQNAEKPPEGGFYNCVGVPS